MLARQQNFDYEQIPTACACSDYGFSVKNVSGAFFAGRTQWCVPRSLLMLLRGCLLHRCSYQAVATILSPDIRAREAILPSGRKLLCDVCRPLGWMRKKTQERSEEPILRRQWKSLMHNGLGLIMSDTRQCSWLSLLPAARFPKLTGDHCSC